MELSQGELKARAEASATAAAAQPDSPEMRVALAEALASLGRGAEAIGHYRTAVAARPEQLVWRCNLAVLLSNAGRHDEAVRESEAALALDPNCAAALYNQASSLLALGEAATACARLARCAALTPGDARVHNNLGLALAADHRYEAALKSYDEALRLRADYSRALNNRGAAHMALKQFEQALADLDRAIALEPRYTRALNNRGAALRALGRHEAALASYRTAFPDPEALAAATDLLMRELRRGAEALACASELYRQYPERDDVAGAYHGVSQGLARWCDYRGRVEAIVAGVRAGRRPSTPFRFLYVSDDPADQLACASAAALAVPARAPLWRGEIRRHARIRVGYLSSDFYAHATAYLAAGLFERHDRDRFECFAFAHGRRPTDDPMRSRLEAAFEHFEDVEHLSTPELAERIRSVGIDILVDLKGYTSDSRMEVLSYRPAPVQVHYLGYPGTLGALFIDYLIADHYVIPVQDSIHYREQIVRLPYTYQVTDDRRAVNDGSWTRDRAGLPRSGLVLAAFHQTYKLSPPLFDAWMRLLHRLPDACLWLLAKQPAAQRQLLLEAVARGVRPERIVFAPEVPQADHLARQRLGDLLLDTWPYGSHTTASDALWAGLPIVALTGRSFAARVSGSILQAAGLPELITESLADYEALITRLCTEPGRLERLRRQVESSVRASPLFDTAGFTRALEICYERMWARSLAGLPPAPIDVRET
jgi:predicted O-linked N-acetylglucosamine transferase (SPINDLY family)